MDEGVKYTAIAAHYRSEITGGLMAVGDPMPTVRTLSTWWHVSRNTAQRAITMLKDEGLVTTARRHGTVVAGEPVELLIAIETPLLVLSTTLATADPHVAGSLGVAEGSNVLVIRMMQQRSQVRDGVLQE